MKLRVLLFIICYLSFSGVAAQTQMKVTLTDGRIVQLPLSGISDISVEPVVPEALAQLAGQWKFIAMPNGVTGEGGIYTATADTIAFTATVAPDGMGLVCRAESFYTRSGNVYPATWRMLMEEDAASGRHRIGWVLDASEPVSEKEFDEPQEKYLDNGFFYWGVNSKRTGGDTGHRYIYLLAENIDASAIVGMTFWSPWSDEGTTEYALSNEENQAQKMYAVVSENIPYSGNVGWIEIWSSPKILHLSGSSGINELPSPDTQHPSLIYDLQGRRMSQPIQKGIYIRDGKKYYIH